MLLYVDDLIVSRNYFAALQAFKAYFTNYFRMKDLGSLRYFLGEVARSSTCFFFYVSLNIH